MSLMTFEEIRACIEGDGWPVEILSEATMRSQFRGAGALFPLFVHTEAYFVTLAVIPFARLPEKSAVAVPLMRRLLQINREINLAKFSIDDDGDVILSVEYRIEDLDPSEIRDAVDVLSFYAEKYHGEVLALGASPASTREAPQRRG
jgi:hypothetical protein